MKIPDRVRKTVAFIGFRNHLTEDFQPVGSVLFMGPDPVGGKFTTDLVFAVTARHVIDGLRSRACLKAVVRMNGLSGGIVEREIPVEDWQFHPTDPTIDAAVAEFPMPHDTDHLVFPYSLGGDNQQFSLHGVELGDEVFISGLFSHHYGEYRNIPIVRIGNLAALREEPVFTPSFGAMDAYLIEARSIGGLSGSPVFVNLGNMRTLDGMQVISGGGPKFFLLGLIHGHFDAVALVGDAAEQDSTLAAKAVNAGIAIVVPYPSIQSTIQGYKRAPHFQTLTFSSNGTLSIASSLPQDTAGL